MGIPSTAIHIKTRRKWYNSIHIKKSKLLGQLTNGKLLWNIKKSFIVDRLGILDSVKLNVTNKYFEFKIYYDIMML